MNRRNRREFLQTAAGALAMGMTPAPTAATVSANTERVAAASSTPQASDVNAGKKPLRLGLIVDIGKDPDAAMAKVRDLGLPTCQVFTSDVDLGIAARLRAVLDARGIEATSLVVGGPGREVWDFLVGP